MCTLYAISEPHPPDGPQTAVGERYKLHIVVWALWGCGLAVPGSFAAFFLFFDAKCRPLSYRILRSSLFEGHLIIGMANIYYAYNGLLCILQVLHCIWFYMILRMVYFYVFKGEVGPSFFRRFTDYFSGPGRAFGLVCMCVYDYC